MSNGQYEYPIENFSQVQDLTSILAAADESWDHHGYSSVPPYSSAYIPTNQWSTAPPAACTIYDATLTSGPIDHPHSYSPIQSPVANFPAQRFSASSESGNSVQSTSSSALGSPHMPPQFRGEESSWNMPAVPIDQPNDPNHDGFYTRPMEHDPSRLAAGYVDPSSILAQGGMPSPIGLFPYPGPLTQPASPVYYGATSPPQRPDSAAGKARKSPRQAHIPLHHPYSQQRRPSTSSLMSRASTQRSTSFEDDNQPPGTGVCSYAECGKSYKDLKAHMLTHLSERPEKCPIPNCDYHIKGFARKYDKNRHTLTHYKGTMVCGFCPGSGSSAEKSFNRADVFKRHLTSVHHVEQVPPNARRKSPIARKNAGTVPDGTLQQSGLCSTCNITFPNPQEFYEHLDDCVLRVVQQIDPSEDINQRNLKTISEDKEVKATLEKNHVSGDEVAEDAAESDDEDDESKPKLKKEASGGGSSWQQPGRATKRGRSGLTLSRAGVRLSGPAGSGRKKRKNYPASWGCGPEKMIMKKRVVCIYDGPRRLLKDDLMLDSQYEVRVPMPNSSDSRAYVTDLDVQTMRRADAIFGASEEERGPWVPDNIISEGEAQQPIFL